MQATAGVWILSWVSGGEGLRHKTIMMPDFAA
jgi:hypothetical protein